MTVPLVVLFSPCEPDRFALTEPSCISNVLVLDKVPVVPVMLPPLATVTVPAPALKAPRLSVPPLTVTALAVEIALSPP